MSRQGLQVNMEKNKINIHGCSGALHKFMTCRVMMIMRKGKVQPANTEKRNRRSLLLIAAGTTVATSLLCWLRRENYSPVFCLPNEELNHSHIRQKVLWSDETKYKLFVEKFWARPQAHYPHSHALVGWLYHTEGSNQYCSVSEALRIFFPESEWE